MKVQKNKIVMIVILLSVVLFIVGYSIITFGKQEEDSLEDKQPPVPQLEKDPEQYTTKMEALDHLEEERIEHIPEVYNEDLFDTTGTYREDQLAYEKQQLIDSVYQQYSDNSRIRQAGNNTSTLNPSQNTLEEEKQLEQLEELGLEHQLFFAANGVNTVSKMKGRTDEIIPVSVDGEQKISTNERLSLRLGKKSWIGGKQYLKNTPIYATVNFAPNRTLLKITHIQEKEVQLNAFDLQDGGEGVYLKNSFQQEATREVLDQTVGSINIPTVPQVSGLKNLFRRNNRNVKVTILDQYQMNLKPVKQ